MCAAVYLCLSRIVVAKGPQYSRLQPRTYTILFVTSDLICLLLQVAGGSIIVAAESSGAMQIGIQLVLSGLSVQVISLALFLGLWAEFHIRYRRAAACNQHSIQLHGSVNNEPHSTELSGLASTSRFKLFQIGKWTDVNCYEDPIMLKQSVNLGLVIAASCIFIRSIYRLVELHAGFSSKFFRNEPASIALEGPMIIVASTIIGVLHPGWAFRGKWHDASLWLREENRHG